MMRQFRVKHTYLRRLVAIFGVYGALSLLKIYGPQNTICVHIIGLCILKKKQKKLYDSSQLSWTLGLALGHDLFSTGKTNTIDEKLSIWRELCRDIEFVWKDVKITSQLFLCFFVFFNEDDIFVSNIHDKTDSSSSSSLSFALYAIVYE